MSDSSTTTTASKQNAKQKDHQFPDSSPRPQQAHCDMTSVLGMLFHNAKETARGQQGVVVALPAAMFGRQSCKWAQSFDFMRDVGTATNNSDQVWCYYDGFDVYDTEAAARNSTFAKPSYAFQNPEFYRAQAMRMPTFDKPRIIACAELFPQHLGLPRGCMDELPPKIRASK
jgi:hypothetical protein